MPHFGFTSAKEVLARVIRGVGYKLPSVYHDDILEWLPEGINYIQTTTSLVTKSSGDMDCPDQIVTRNHCAPLPCGFVSILAVEDEHGLRLPEGSDITDITLQTSARHVGVGIEGEARITTFEANPLDYQTSTGAPTTKPGTSIPWDGSDIVQRKERHHSRQYYKIQGNYIQTSFESQYIRIHYLALPTDKEGYPLIPNNENFKQALEWHILRRLIGAGYQHPVFSWDKVDEQFNIYAGRAMNEISYASLDTRARTWRSTVRLIPPYQYDRDFFIGAEQGEHIMK